MVSALEIVAAISCHRVYRRPAHRNDRQDEQRKPIKLVAKIAEVVQCKRDEGEDGFLPRPRKKPEQRNGQEEMFPFHFLWWHERIPGDEHGEKRDVEDFRRSGPRLHQVDGHSAEKSGRGKGRPVAFKPDGEREEKGDKAYQVKGKIDPESRIAVRFPQTVGEGMDKAQCLSLEIVHFDFAVQVSIRPDALVADSARTIKVHLEPHRFPAGFVGKHPMRIFDVVEGKYRKESE